jgi:hypothetical protein
VANVSQRSFQFGELSPAFYARTDTQAYAQGLRTLRNAYVMRTGGVQNRGGLVRKGNTKGNGVARLIPCEFSDEQNYVLEFTDERVRIWQNGALVKPGAFGTWTTGTPYIAGLAVTNGGDSYYCYLGHTSGASTEPGVGVDWEDYWTLANEAIEIPTPYQDTELDELVAVVIAPGPSTGTLIIVHPSYAPRLLKQASASAQTWSLTTATLGSSVPAPASFASTVGGTGGFIYAVTAVDADGNESTLSNTAETNNTSLSFASTTLSWSSVTGAISYKVYRTTFGSFGLLGSSTTTSYVDDAPFGGSLTGPPIELSLFGSTNNYPSTAAIHQQRLLLGATNLELDRVWASVSGQPLNFAVSDPLVDSDSLNWRQISRQSGPQLGPPQLGRVQRDGLEPDGPAYAQPLYDCGVGVSGDSQ